MHKKEKFLCPLPAREEIGERSVRVMLIPAVVAISAMSIFLVANFIWGLSLLTSISFVATMPVLPQGSWLGAWLANSFLMTCSVAIAFFLLIRGFIARAKVTLSV